jgi:hypothetical protein
MLLIYTFAIIALVGFVCSLFMGITIVGVCRYGDRYRRFFDRLKKLGTLATIKEMSRVYLDLLNKFLGKDVGIRQAGVLVRAKYFGLYIEHLLLLYWIGGTILVLAFRPVEPSTPSASSLLQALAFVVLLTINIFSDAVSLLWTKRCIALLVIPDIPLTTRRLLVVLVQDISVAFALMIFVQLVSNGLYAVQIGHNREFFRYMLDWRTAIKEYHAIDPHFSRIEFPGQLVITCTTYIPSLLFYLTCLTILCLIPFYRALMFVMEQFDLESAIDRTEYRGQSCSPLGYIGSLTGVLGFAVGCGTLFVSTWPFIRPS